MATDPERIEALAREVGAFLDAQDEAAIPGQAIGKDVLNLAQLRNLPRPSPLIERTLDLRTVALLAGPWGSGKSFIALDWCLCIASSRVWQGRQVGQTGRVLYVAAEGAYGLSSRIDAWSAAWRTDVPDGSFYVYPKPVNLLDGRAVAELCLYVESNGFLVVVFDTLSRCLVGGEENSAKDMGIAIDNAYRIRRHTVGEAGTVLLVHHMGKDRSTIRGSSALEAGVDTVYTIDTNDTTNIKLTRTKRKDGPPGDQLNLRLGTSGDSCIVVSGLGAALGNNEDRVVRALESGFSQVDGVLSSTLREVAGLEKNRFYEARDSLARKGIIRIEGTPRSQVIYYLGRPDPEPDTDD